MDTEHRAVGATAFQQIKALWRRVLKSPLLRRLLDVTVALLLIVALLPVMLVLAILIRFKLGAPVIVRQPWQEYRGQPLLIYRFRSTSDAHEAPTRPRDEVRLTPFGVFLRASSLDELPALFNVLRGEMSLVGNHPFLTGHLDGPTPKPVRRRPIRLGKTGWMLEIVR